jgi:UDP-N-acetylmuramoylalanine--D-glutamate ligase
MERLVVLGGAESGIGAAVLAQKKGFDVFVSDKGKIKEEYKSMLKLNKIKFEEEKHTEELILNADEIVKSPGIPDKSLIIKEALKREIPVVSEIEFASRYTDAKIIGITGTNGKTTATSLTYHILKNAGLNVGLGGNIGKSFALQVAENNYDYYVLELSSFQLDGMFKARLNIAVLLNITPDHLDRYEYEFENYIRSKFRIAQNQTSNDVFIYCKDDEITNKYINLNISEAKLIPFSIKETVEEGAFLENESELIININNNPFSMSIHDLALQGKHNIYNSMAAGIAAKVLEIRKDIIRDSLSDFENIEHRLEFVTKVHGIDFINDSKATNVNSTWYALESMNSPVVWIVGGVDKGNDYNMLKDLVKEKVKAIICLGTENEKIHKAFSSIVPSIVDANSADEAVKRAYQLSKNGDVVLLSPACASFDMFENFEDRGRQFKKAVRSL